MMRPRRVAYLWSEDMQAAADQLPSNLGRSSVVHDLIRDLDLLDNGGVPRDLERDGRQGDAGRRSGGVGARGDLLRARVVRPDIQLGNEDNMKRYHDPKYVEYLMNPTTHRNKGDDVGTDSDSDGYSTDMTGDSNDSYTRSERPAKRRRTEHGLEHDCPSFPALPAYAALIAAAAQTACRELLAGTADVAVCWDGGRHHAMRNRASGFCYVADVVLGIMALAKSGRPRPLPAALSRQETADNDEPSEPTPEVNVRGGANEVDVLPSENGTVGEATIKETRGAENVSEKSSRETEGAGGPKPAAPGRPLRPPRRPRIMYIDLDIHEGDGVHQAFLSPSRYPPSSSMKIPPRPPQVLTLSIHHHSRTFFPPHKPFSGLPDRETPNPFTLSIPLHAYASPPTYAGVWPSVQAVKEAFDPDYVVLQLGLDGLPGDRVGQYGAWGTEGPGGLRWCVQQIMAWDLPLCVLGGGGYDNANAARGWAIATAELLGRQLDEDTHVPDHEYLPLYAPSFTLEVPRSSARDENGKEYIAEIDDTFSHIAERIRHILAAYSA